MNRLMLTCLVCCMLLLSSLPCVAQLEDHVAYYPLVSDDVDETGNNGPITLVNAPFQNGGVYCNGNYSGEPDEYLVETPTLSGLDFGGFAISVEFMIPSDHNSLRPVIVGGHGQRWMGVELTMDRTLILLYLNSVREQTDVEVSPDAWHRAQLVYDGTTDTGSLYLDDAFVVSASFVLDPGSEKNMSTTNFASGLAFKGHIRHLRVYDHAAIPSPVEGATWGRVKTLFD